MKKLISFIMAVTIFLSVGVFAYADEPESGNGAPNFGVIFSNEPDELNEEEQILVDMKVAQALAFASMPSTRAVTKISIPGTFTMYKQENSTLCTAACVQSVLKYLTGVLYSQSKVANDMGYNLVGILNSAIAPYLNKMQAKHFYSRATKPSQANMALYIYTAIAGNKVPAIMCIYNPSGANWYYKTSGHTLVVNAVYSDRSKVQFADPLGNYISGVPVFYEKTANIAHGVCNDLIW